MLNGEIKRLEEGATQESSKRILQSLSRQFAYLSKENSMQQEEYTKLCQNASNRVEGFIQGVVYVKDLRYLLCDLCNGYLKLSKNFAL